MKIGYCMYLRKSRADLEAEARGEGETLKRHENILLALAKSMNIYIPEKAIYREVESGETIADRPVIQHVLSEVEQKLWKGVFVVEVERLARGDTIDQGVVAQAFKYSNTKIVTPMKVYDPNNEYDEEYFEFGLFMARRAYKTITRTLQRGRVSSVTEGKYVGSIPPYGYERIKLEKEKGYTLEPNSEEADIVKMIFALYVKGELQPDGAYKRLGVSLLKRKLNDMRIPAAKGGLWTESTLQGMLQNPVYAGYIRWNWRKTVKKIVNGEITKERPRAKDYMLIPGIHEPLIDMETWELAQYYYGLNRPSPVPGNKEIKNPLSGLIICGICGRKMKRRPYSNKNPDTLMCSFSSCSNVSSQLSYVEEKLLQALEKWLFDYKLNWTIDDNNISDNLQIEVKKQALDKLENEIKILEKQMNNLHDLLEQGVYSVDKFMERSSIITKKTNALLKNKETLSNDLQIEMQREKAKKQIIPKVEKVLELYRKTKSPALKNEQLKEILEKVVYTKTVNGRWHNRPDDFELILYPKLK